MANKNEVKIAKVKLVACKDDMNFFECPICHKVYDNAVGENWDDCREDIYCECGAYIEKPKTIEIKYKGYIIGQSSYNYHTYISKDGKSVGHIQTHEQLNEKQLQELIDNWLIFKKTIVERTK